MTFDSHSLERLRELGRKLPKSIPQSNKNSNSEKKTTRNLHPIETEDDPKKLFQELIKVSVDGNIPSHLMERLKKAESKELKTSALKNNNVNSEYIKESMPNFQKNLQSADQYDDLYISFKQLLLEEDDDN